MWPCVSTVHVHVYIHTYIYIGGFYREPFSTHKHPWLHWKLQKQNGVLCVLIFPPWDGKKAICFKTLQMYIFYVMHFQQAALSCRWQMNACQLQIRRMCCFQKMERTSSDFFFFTSCKPMKFGSGFKPTTHLTFGDILKTISIFFSTGSMFLLHFDSSIVLLQGGSSPFAALWLTCEKSQFAEPGGLPELVPWRILTKRW